MRSVLPACFALALASAPTLSAQDSGAAKPAQSQEILLAQGRRQPIPVATPIPTTPAPKKKGFFERVFSRDAKEAATPAAVPAPAPAAAAATPAPATPRGRSKRRATPEREEEPAQKPPAPEEKAAPEKPAAKAESKEPMTEVAAKKTSKPKTSKTAAKEKEQDEEESAPKENLTAEQQAVKNAEASGDPVAIEKAKYDEVKSRAVQDEKIVALKEKADAATDEEEGRKALRAYNKALFQKMRSLDGSIRERVDLMEDAVMKRLEPTTAAKK